MARLARPHTIGKCLPPLVFLMAEPIVTFWGAARAVTGSMHLVEAAERRILLLSLIHI